MHYLSSNCAMLLPKLLTTSLKAPSVHAFGTHMFWRSQKQLEQKPCGCSQNITLMSSGDMVAYAHRQQCTAKLHKHGCLPKQLSWSDLSSGVQYDMQTPKIPGLWICLADNKEQAAIADKTQSRPPLQTRVLKSTPSSRFLSPPALKKYLQDREWG
jgi:hypothetical protein